MINIRIRFGSDEVSRQYAAGTTVATVLADHELRVVLGYGDNVRALVSGVEQNGAAIVPDGAKLVIETRANSKAN